MLDRELINNVLNNDFTIKLCGREACKKLILHLREEFPNSGKTFGDENKGRLNIVEIKEVLKEVL